MKLKSFTKIFLFSLFATCGLLVACDSNNPFGGSFSPDSVPDHIIDSGEVNHEHPLEHHQVNVNACEGKKTVDYWYCPTCDLYFLQNNIVAESEEEIVKSFLNHSTIYVSKKDSTCTEEGVLGHYECTKCHRCFTDYLGIYELNPNDLVIAKKPHNFIHHDQVDSTCFEKGNIEYYECLDCHKYFSDPNGENELTYDQVFSIEPGHKFDTNWSYDANEHWHNAICEHTDLRQDVEPHNIVDGKCTVCGYMPIEFEIFEENYYAIRKVHMKDQKDIFIPSTYNNLPIWGFYPDCFEECNALENLYFDGTLEQWMKAKSCPFEAKCTIPHLFVKNSIYDSDYHEVVNINVYESIGQFAFEGCTGLKTVNFEAYEGYIDPGSFYNCSSLESVYICGSTKNVYSLGFIGCTSLKEIVYDNDKATWESILRVEDQSLEGVPVYTYWYDSYYMPTENGYYWTYSSEGMREKFFIQATYNDYWSVNEYEHWHELSSGNGGLYKDRGSHNFVDGKCVDCGYEYYHLDYELSSDKSYYIVTGLGNVYENNIIIPDTYLGLPVLEIKENSFVIDTSRQATKTIFVPTSVNKISKNSFATDNMIVYFESDYNPALAASLGETPYYFNVKPEDIVTVNQNCALIRDGKLYLTSAYFNGNYLEIQNEYQVGENNYPLGGVEDKFFYQYINREPQVHGQFLLTLNELLNLDIKTDKFINNEFDYSIYNDSKEVLIELGNTLVIPNGITKLSANALGNVSIDYIYIPDSVEVIEPGVLDYSTVVYAEKEVKPGWSINPSNIVYSNTNATNTVLYDGYYLRFDALDNTCDIIGHDSIYNDILYLNDAFYIDNVRYRLKTIKTNAFDDEMRVVVLNMTNPVKIENGAFSSYTAVLVSDYVPTELFDPYWHNDSTTYRGNSGLLYSGPYLLTVQNGEGVIIKTQKNISYYDFFSMPSEITCYGDVYKVTTIADYAFYRTLGLKNLYVSGTIQNISEDTFYGVDTSTTVNIFFENNSTYDDADYPILGFGTPGNYHQYRRDQIKVVDSVIYALMPGGEAQILGSTASYGTLYSTIEVDGKTYQVKSIGKWAFGGSSQHSTNTIPEGIESIGDYAYFESYITTMYLPHSLKSIGMEVFDDTYYKEYNLRKTIYYNGTEEEWFQIQGTDSLNYDLINVVYNYQY